MPFTITGAQVRSIRQALGVSQAELARSLGYTQQAIAKWERQRERSIPRTQYQRVLTAFATRQSALRDLASLAASIYQSSR